MDGEDVTHNVHEHGFRLCAEFRLQSRKGEYEVIRDAVSPKQKIFSQYMITPILQGKL